MKGKYSYDETNEKKELQTTEIKAFKILEQLKYMSIAMLNEDGSPYNVIVDVLTHNGKVYFHSANEGQKIDCLKHDSRICATGYTGAVSDAEGSTTRYASVVIHGKATLMTDEALKKELIWKEAALRGVPAHVIDRTIDQYFDSMAMVEIEIEHITGKVNPAV